MQESEEGHIKVTGDYEDLPHNRIIEDAPEYLLSMQ